MNQQSWLIRLIAYTVALAMMIGFVNVVYSEESDVTEPAAEMLTEVTKPEPVRDNTIVTRAEAPEIRLTQLHHDQSKSGA